jgi:putative molybdopterin biosynthesis protein
MKVNLSFQWAIQDQKLDPALFQLLRDIKRLGSLQQAAKTTHVSYRFAWGLMTKWHEIIGQPLVIMERGKGATLSEVGEVLLNSYQQLIARFSPEFDNFASEFRIELETTLSEHEPNRLSVYASHGLAISTFRDLVHQQSKYQLDLHFHGSLDSLRALNNKHCDIAGFHIPMGDMTKKLAPQYLQLLDPKQHQLIYVVKRNQGLIVAKGNPKQLSGIADLTNNIRFINRQADSGTRLLFDTLLEEHNIEPSSINGYQNEEFTHMAVAAMVASNMVDVGFGIAAMAEKFDLAFIPIVWEHYCLAVPHRLMKTDNVQHIVSLLQSDEYQSALAIVSGYDASRAGEMVSFDAIFNS